VKDLLRHWALGEAEPPQRGVLLGRRTALLRWPASALRGKRLVESLCRVIFSAGPVQQVHKSTMPATSAGRFGGRWEPKKPSCLAWPLQPVSVHQWGEPQNQTVCLGRATGFAWERGRSKPRLDRRVDDVPASHGDP
jgi:hypothetical protein